MPLYEQDICNYIRITKGLKIRILDHLTWHVGGSKDMGFLKTQTKEVVEKYKNKWRIL